MKLSPISLAVLPLLTVFTANAAVYQIVELDTPTTVRLTSGVAATQQGDTVVNGSTLLGVNLDLAAINFDSTAIQALLTAEQLEAAREGVVDDTVAGILISYLYANPSLVNQPIGESRVLRYTQSASATPVILRDTNDSKTNTEFAYAANDLGKIAGVATAPSVKDTFTQTIVPDEDDEEGEEEDDDEIPVIPQPFTVWVPEPGYMLGYVADSQNSILLSPSYTALGGGMSAAQDINNHDQVVGFTSAGAPEAVIKTIEESCDGNLQPTAFCLNNSMAARAVNLPDMLNQVRNYQTVQTISEGYQERAAQWQVNADGSATLTKVWGFLGDKGTGSAAPDSEDYTTPIYYSRANAINDSGIAVGHSLYSDVERVLRFYDIYGYEFTRLYSAPHATIFSGDEVSGFIDTHEWPASIAVDINNDNLITGYALKQINGIVRQKLFTYDMASETTTFPTGFFGSSSTEPRAINNQGQIVGRAEVMISGTVSRRFHGFIYDTKNDTFQDLNDLVGCEAPYTVVDATSITDDGEVLATALVKRPLLDRTGKPTVDENGTVVEEEQVTAVKLRPIANGEVANCGVDDTQYERKSGSLSAFWLLLLGAFPIIRRKLAR